MWVIEPEGITQERRKFNIQLQNSEHQREIFRLAIEGYLLTDRKKAEDVRKDILLPFDSFCTLRKQDSACSL